MSPEETDEQSRPNALVSAIAAATAPVPSSFVTFDTIAAGSSPRPDFTEHSVTFGETLTPHRVTHYFDVAGADGRLVQTIGERFVALTDVLGHTLPEATRRLLTTWLPTQRGIAQVVLGIDARATEAATRSKYYVVLGSPSPTLVTTVCRALDVPVMSGLDPAEVYIVGIDADTSGVADLKLYMRLDRRRLHRTIRNVEDVRPLIAGARSVVLQQCMLRSTRRQFHFHATDDRAYQRFLEGRASFEPSVAAMLAHARVVDDALERGRLGPWIVGLPHEDGRLELGRGNVYFHVSDAAR